MFPNYCTAMGLAGWLLMLLIWSGLVFLAVCGIARLFPDKRRGTDPALPPAGGSEDPPNSIVESGRR